MRSIHLRKLKEYHLKLMLLKKIKLSLSGVKLVLQMKRKKTLLLRWPNLQGLRYLRKVIKQPIKDLSDLDLAGLRLHNHRLLRAVSLYKRRKNLQRKKILMVLEWISAVLTLDASHKTNLVVKVTLNAEEENPLAVEAIEAEAQEAELSRLVTADSWDLMHQGRNEFNII